MTMASSSTIRSRIESSQGSASPSGWHCSVVNTFVEVRPETGPDVTSCRLQRASSTPPLKISSVASEQPPTPKTVSLFDSLLSSASSSERFSHAECSSLLRADSSTSETSDPSFFKVPATSRVELAPLLLPDQPGSDDLVVTPRRGTSQCHRKEYDMTPPNCPRADLVNFSLHETRTCCSDRKDGLPHVPCLPTLPSEANKENQPTALNPFAPCFLQLEEVQPSKTVDQFALGWPNRDVDALSHQQFSSAQDEFANTAVIWDQEQSSSAQDEFANSAVIWDQNNWCQSSLEVNRIEFADAFPVGHIRPVQKVSLCDAIGFSSPHRSLREQHHSNSLQWYPAAPSVSEAYVRDVSVLIRGIHRKTTSTDILKKMASLKIWDHNKLEVRMLKSSDRSHYHSACAACVILLGGEQWEREQAAQTFKRSMHKELFHGRYLEVVVPPRPMSA